MYGSILSKFRKRREAYSFSVAGQISFVSIGIDLTGTCVGASQPALLFRTDSQFAMILDGQLVQLLLQGSALEGYVKKTTKRGYWVVLDDWQGFVRVLSTVNHSSGSPIGSM